MSQINAVEAPIINLPYVEPAFHWHIEAAKQPEKRPGRRQASYFFRVPERAARGAKGKVQKALFDDASKGQEYLLDLANLIRLRIKEWRAREYAGATKVTRELLALWHDPERSQRLFFAQLEAVESVLFLVEGPDDLKQGVVVPSDEPGEDAKAAGYKAFVRYALKMATGSGKTTVMGMLAAWSILNKVNDAQAAAYSDTVLIVCPNVTIRDRLRELDPNQDELSLYRTRQLVPLHRMPELRRGEVFITNWHNLERRELGDVSGSSARVVRRGTPVEKLRTIKLGGRDDLSEADIRHQALTGAFDIVRELRDKKEVLTGFEVKETRYYESDAAFLRRVLGNRKGRSSAILVMNDEAHHAYRRGKLDADDTYAIDEETAEVDAREATVWIEGLDRINKALGGRANRGNGIRLCVDLSATPFFIQGSGNEVGKPFPWVVSDFSLLEAIEAGLVKIPQLPTQDGGGTATPAYFNVWRWVQEIAEKDGLGKGLTPELLMRYATQPIVQMADEWRKTAADWQMQFAAGHRKSDVPPVFIIVCRDTALAKEMHDWLAHGKSEYGAAPEYFRNAPGREWTVRVDSKVAEDIAEGGGKNDEARRLRFVLETIGKTAWHGNQVPEEYTDLVNRHNHRALDDDNGLVTLDASVPPGRDVRCIISVAMLSEGWDATTVTHVVGLRPFGSQLLCEQVVGRALRRTSYAVDEATGFFREETAKVFGVPFELIPFKVEGGAQQPPSPPANQIYAVPAKSGYEIRFPVVEGYTDPGITRLAIDWATVPKLKLDPMTVPDTVLMKGLAGADGALAAYGPGAVDVMTLDAWRAGVRVQQVAFTLAKVLSQQWVQVRGDTIPMHRVFPQMLGYTQRFLATKLDCMGNRAAQDVALNPYFQKAVALLFDALHPVDASGAAMERPLIAPGPAGERSTRFVEFATGRQPWAAHKCHLNAIVADTKTWEQAAATALDAHPAVRSWVKNDHLGFVVPYRKDGLRKRYLPDFIVELASGERLIVEIKGQPGDAEIKAAAAQRWCRAVNNDGRFGRWSYHLVMQPANLSKLLDQVAMAVAA
ncbi:MULTISPECIES: BPTD_3080 family restriction endonuclease [unclassified Roseateles]|uniref:BPTD_3080 family restriction endonuclease n=1 Tax=unclassified Roseateles TaxID=2626991 RepID=UPI0006F58E8D|nr:MULTISPECIES: DEAD/DEAH box helicase family protein [unclassified Roseateles]KQW46703.1 hydrolase [Pelomonas sp. Root405]KRA73755.1 hydrolase [Pelomonas sp. Root662]